MASPQKKEKEQPTVTENRELAKRSLLILGMAQDIPREAKKRKTQVAEEVRRRLEFYASHKHLLEPPAADQRPTE